MKILYIVPYTPNQIRVRPYSLLRELNRQGHEIVLATLYSSAQDQADLAALAQQGIDVIAHPLSSWRSLTNALLALPSVQPLQATYCWQPSLAAAINARLATEHFDVVHVEHLRGAIYGLQIKQPALPVVWDSVDSISHLFAQAAQSSRSLKGRLMTALELKRTQQHEAWLLRQFERVLVTSKHDRNALLGLPSPAGAAPLAADHVRVLPNGVDLDYFAPNQGERETASLVFSGKMSYHANITAAIFLIEDMMPRVWAKRPDVKVYLVGKDPTAEVRRLARQATATHGEVIVTGTVPDLRPYLQRAAVAVAPIAYGAGIQNKVLEAMACAAPVVTTPQAVSALDLGEEEGVLVADNAVGLAENALALLADAERRHRLGQAGREYVSRRHNWSKIVADLVEVYADSMERSVGVCVGAASALPNRETLLAPTQTPT